VARAAAQVVGGEHDGDGITEVDTGGLDRWSDWRASLRRNGAVIMDGIQVRPLVPPPVDSSHGLPFQYLESGAHGVACGTALETVCVNMGD
jgi:hypothetical protein